jgi:hypothetical protein
MGDAERRKPSVRQRLRNTRRDLMYQRVNRPNASLLTKIHEMADQDGIALVTFGRNVEQAMDLPTLPDILHEWFTDQVGKPLMLANKTTNEQRLIGYVLPAGAAYLIFFNNGHIYKGEVTGDTRKSSFTPSATPFRSELSDATYKAEETVSDNVVDMFLGWMQRERGLLITLSNRTREEREALAPVVSSAIQGVEEARRQRKAQVEAGKTKVIGEMELETWVAARERSLPPAAA